MDTPERQYEDILAPRRKECSNFLWVSRQLHPKCAYKQTNKPTPEQHKEQVLKSRKIQELLTVLSKQQNVDKLTLEAQVRDILNEIGYNRRIHVIRWLGLVLVKICLRINTGIYANHNRILQIKQEMGGCPVVFVPSHRSYADFILMALMFFHKDIAMPTIAAGMDFHGMWGMGSLLRDVGAFFMRRSYNDDALYWTTFKQYVYQLITKSDLPMKFFIEGTRSRSNKSLLPKYGLITMILKPLFLAEVPDILFVPVNISYDRILEEKLFAFELLGIPKPKESTKGFLKSLSILKEQYGSIYFDFATPISAKQFFGDALDRSVHNLQPIHQQEITENERKLIPALAHHIVHKQQKHCVITTFNLLALLLDNNLTNGGELFTVPEFAHEILWLKQILEQFGAFVKIDDVHESIAEALKVHQDTVMVNEKGQITLRWDSIVLDQFNPNKLKAHELSEKTITFSVPFILLQIYINPVLHYLVDAAILVIVLKYYKPQVTKDELFTHYHFLRSLLSQEFVTFPARENMEFEEALGNCLKLNLMSKNGNIFELGSNLKGQQVIYTSLDCFIYSYFTVCCILLECTNIIDEKTILARAQEEIEVGVNDDKIFIHPYAMSLDTITNCLSILSSQGALKKTRNAGTVFYEIDKNNLRFIKERLEHCVPTSQVLERKFENIQIHLKTKL